MIVTTLVDCGWLVKIIVLWNEEATITSLGKKFVGKIFNNLNPLNVLKRCILGHQRVIIHWCWVKWSFPMKKWSLHLKATFNFVSKQAFFKVLSHFCWLLSTYRLLFSPCVSVVCIFSPWESPSCANRPKSGGHTDKQTNQQTDR